MNNLILRTISGILLVVLVYGSLILGEYTTIALCTIIFTGSMYEVKKIFSIEHKLPFIFAVVSGIAIMIVLSFTAKNDSPSFPLIVLLYAFFLTFIALRIFLNAFNINKLRLLILAGIIIAGSIITFYLVGKMQPAQDFAPILMIALITLIWVNDIGAYIVGSLIGKTQLAQHISPGKTWEGFAGGLLLSIIAAYFFALIVFENQNLKWVIIAAIVSITATIGDLFESKVKRIAGVKDSGGIIPGHGGMLDRFDSLLFSAPIFYILIYFLIIK